MNFKSADFYCIFLPSSMLGLSQLFSINFQFSCQFTEKANKFQNHRTRNGYKSLHIYVSYHIPNHYFFLLYVHPQIKQLNLLAGEHRRSEFTKINVCRFELLSVNDNLYYSLSLYCCSHVAAYRLQLTMMDTATSYCGRARQ